MEYENITTDYLKEHGTMVSSIIIKKREDLLDVFLEDEGGEKTQIAKLVDFVSIEGITKDNKLYHIMMVSEGEFYILDYILYKESVDEEFKTLALLIPIYWPNIMIAIIYTIIVTNIKGTNNN